jgi:hypothetical protein
MCSREDSVASECTQEALTRPDMLSPQATLLRKVRPA